MTGNLHININAFDTIVLSIFFLSTVIAFFRGFIRELLSFGAWVGAAVITIYFFPHSDAFMRHYIKNPQAATGAGALIIYFIALITISIMNSIIMRYVKNADVGLLDNFLGMAFGALRGVFILSFGYLILTAVVPKSPQPDWLKASITKDYLKSGADRLVAAAPGYMTKMEAVIKKQVDHEINPQDYPSVDGSRDVKPVKTQELNNAIR